MDTSTGQIYESEEITAAMEFASDRMRAEAMAELSEHEREALMKLANGVNSGRVVPVSEEVVQKVRLGERELKRRRRRQQRDARRRNR